MFVFLILLGTLLPASSDKVHAVSDLRLDYDITVHIRIAPANASTPDPGTQVFHFNIWSAAGVPLTITNNAVYTYGYGIMEGHLTFSVSSDYDARLLQSEQVYVQQYDGNENWVFDMRLAEFFYDTRGEGFFNDWYYGDAGYDFLNTYNPVTPPAPPTPVTPDPPSPPTPVTPDPPTPVTPDPPVNPTPTEPDPKSSESPEGSDPKDDGDDEKDDVYINHGSLTCYIKLNKSYAPRNGEFYYADDEVVLWVTVFNSVGGKTIFDIDFEYTIRTKANLYGGNIYFDPMLYNGTLAGKPWYIEQLHSGNTVSYMYYHKVTPEEAKAGKFVIQIKCGGHDRYGYNFTSNTAEIELKTSGTYYDPFEDDDREPEEEKPAKKQLTLELYESTQPKHHRGTLDFYAMGDMVKYKVVVKNEANKYFYNIDVRNDLVEDETFHIDILAPGSSKTFYFYARVGQIEGSRSHLTCNAWASYKDWYDHYEEVQSDPCIVDTAIDE